MRISVIIPALNEETALPATLASLKPQRPYEVIVVDGGSTDATHELAAASADRLLTGVRGRAARLDPAQDQAAVVGGHSRPGFRTN